jgi:hypothetical protein
MRIGRRRKRNFKRRLGGRRGRGFFRSGRGRSIV